MTRQCCTILWFPWAQPSGGRTPGQTAGEAHERWSDSLAARTQQAEVEATEVKTPADQFLLGAGRAPRRYRARFHKNLYAGPNVRRDAERTWWIEVIASMLLHTPTPMGKLLAERPKNPQLLGGRSRASTFAVASLRCRSLPQLVG